MIFIAEIGSNHLGDLGRAKEMVRAVADCGAQIAKFQLFKPEQYPYNIAVPEEWIDTLRMETSKAGIGLLFSVFYPCEWNLGVVKIAYSQRHNFSLVDYWSKRADLIVSGDGDTHWPKCCTKLYCSPNYPAQTKDYKPIDEEYISGNYDGVSDHTVGMFLYQRNKKYKWWEKHFKLGDEAGRSPDAGDFAVSYEDLKKCLKP